MKKPTDIVSDFEDLIKLKEFHLDKKLDAYLCTYEQVSHSLKNEYVDNIDSKVNRWANVTHLLYLKDSLPVRFYFQSKMLYRDGFYEATITMSRAICEMICYDLLRNISHPFGNLELIEKPIFRMLVNYIALPKKIGKSIFEKQIINKIKDNGDRNILKSSYLFNQTNKYYGFVLETGFKENNFKRLLKIFKEIGFRKTDNFKEDTHQYMHQVYDLGNIYVHAKKGQNQPKKDATKCLDMLAHILSDIYGVKTSLKNKIIKSGYTDFPDICKGMNFAITAFLTPEDAMRGYYNLPSRNEIEKLLSTKGTWDVEWQIGKSENKKGILTFYMDGEYLKADLIYSKGKVKTTEPMDIKLYGNYFRIKGFDPLDMKHNSQKHIHFELELFSDSYIIGKNLTNSGIVLLKRLK
jgi:hypothetical protein